MVLNRQTEGAQQATDAQIQQKPSRNFISGPVNTGAKLTHLFADFERFFSFQTEICPKSAQKTP